MERKKRLWTKLFNACSVGILLIFSLFLLCSCGSSGDGGDISSQGIKLSGTVATGVPLQRTFVTFRDGNGNRYTDITDNEGKYKDADLLANGLTLPVLIRVQDPTAGVMYSYAYKSGTANVHPLTDPIVRAWYRVKYQQGNPNRDLDWDFFNDTALILPTQSEIDFIKAVVLEVLENLLMAIAESTDGLKDDEGNIVPVADFDPMETPFNADGTGFDRILDETEIDTSDETGNLNIMVEDGSGLENDIEDSGGSTTITLDTDNIVQTDTTPPGKPSTPSALQVSDAQILVTWTISDPNEAYYTICQNGEEVGIVTSTVFVAPIDPNISQSYTYTISACDAAGNCSEMSDPSNEVTITAIAADMEDPDAGTLTATALGFDEIKLTWTGFSDNVGIVGYKVYACSDGMCTTSELIAKVPGTPFIHFRLSADTTYYYSVTAVDAAGNESALSNVASATTGSALASTDVTPPDIPTGFIAEATAYNQIDLTWTAPLDPDDDLAGYYIYRGGVEHVMLESDATSYSDENLEAETTYSYWIKAFDVKGNISDIATASATTPEAPDLTPPSVPTDVTASADNENQISISWSASTDDDSGIAGYYVYRGEAKIATVTTGTSHEDSGLNPETTYSYQVSAYDIAGNESDKSTTASATTPAGPPPNVSGLISDAMACLEAQDIPGANAKFKSAHTLDPNNKDANFGLAITDGIMLLEDPEVISFFNTYETYKPTIENILYGVMNNNYEVWGGISPLCGNETLEPGSYGYTKLSDPNLPVTDFSGYQYYVIYATPFSKLEVTVSGTEVLLYCDYEAWITSMGPNTFSATIGGETLFGSSMTVYAPSGMTLSVPEGVQRKSVLKRIRNKGLSTTVENDSELPFAGELRSMLNKLPKNKRSVRTRMKILTRSLAEGPPSPVDVQSLIDSALLPAINGMIANLRNLEGTGYEFTITPAMTGGAETEDIVLDDGEFYAIDAMLSVLKCIMNLMTAYDLSVDFDIMEYDPLSQINSTSFFTLRTDGVTKMAGALTALQEAVESAESAYNFVFDEWGYSAQTFNDGFETCEILVPQSDPNDNGIKLHYYDEFRPCEYGGPYDFTTEDHSEITNFFEVAKLVVSGQVTFTEENASGVNTGSITDGTTTVTLWEESTTEPDGVEFTLTADATRFFTVPLDRYDLPTFSYDLPIDLTQSQLEGRPVHIYAGPDGVAGNADDIAVSCDFFMTSNLPDYTLNGIFPNGIPEFDGFLYLERAVVLDPQTWSGWNQAVATDGTSIYLYKQDNPGAPSAKIWTIDPATGYVIDTNSLDLNSNANGISWINDMTWHNGALWVSGGYGDSSGVFQRGVFQINLANSQSSNQIPAGSGIDLDGAGLGGLASDGTNLYVGVDLISAESGLGLVKFNPASVTEIPSSPFFAFEYMPWDVVYGGGYLWLDDGTLKVNPVDGSIVKEYGTEGWVNMYLNNRLYSVDAQDEMRIHVLREPGT